AAASHRTGRARRIPRRKPAPAALLGRVAGGRVPGPRCPGLKALDPSIDRPAAVRPCEYLRFRWRRATAGRNPATYLGQVVRRPTRELKVVLAAALLLAAGGAHSTSTGKTAEVKDATAPQPTGAAVRARKVTPKTPPGHPPLAASPSELMEPGSQEKIARALKNKGVIERDDVRGEQLSMALRKFQQSEGLAATGFPDHETVLRLGLDPEEIDRSLENFSGTRPEEAEADVGKGSNGPGKAEGKRSGNDTPPKDEAGEGGSGH